MALNFYNCFTVTIMLIFFSTTAAMGASLTVAPSMGSTFTVYGSGLSNVGGIELSLSYDGSPLEIPKVTEGSLISGALTATNTATPGSIKVVIISTTAISGSGSVVVINFASKTNIVRILSFNAGMTDIKGIQIPVQSSVSTDSSNILTEFISTPGVPFSQPLTPNTATTTSSTPPIPSVTSTSTPPTPSEITTISTPPRPNTTVASDTVFTTILGTMPVTSELITRSDEKPPETKLSDTPDTSAQVTPSAQTVEQPPVTKPVESPTTEILASDLQIPEKETTTTSFKGVLENFMTYKGDKSPSIFTTLFNKKIAPNIRQEPAIAISDGKTPLKVFIKLGNMVDKSPNFALKGAKLVSLNKDNSSIWIIEALPQIGIVQASLTIMTNSNTIEYPLTLAPPIESVSNLMADFIIFINDSGAASPKYDLNKDKKHDYLDDYIYTANYIFKNNTAEKSK